MPKTEKDRPLLLRRRDDGLYLQTDTWPPRHEFSTDWLLTSGVATISDQDEIVLELKNARAVYTIDRSAMESVDDDGRTTQLSTGYWGVLKEGHVDG